ncbi:Vestitone reductase [Glycine max]|nr:Vestitone reductase [Glycine max]
MATSPSSMTKIEHSHAILFSPCETHEHSRSQGSRRTIGNTLQVCFVLSFSFYFEMIEFKDYNIFKVEHRKDVSFLTSLPGSSQRLQILSADLSNPESIGVFHVATPVDFQVKEPEETCLNSKTVKRVVYTTSVGAVVCNSEEDQVMDESFWSDVDYLRSSKILKWSYAVSKTSTEKNGLDVVTIAPPLVLGPFICPKLPDSISDALNLSIWLSACACACFNSNNTRIEKCQKAILVEIYVERDKDPLAFNDRIMVHVEDVVRVHIFLLEHPDPKGRYICSSYNTPVERVYQFVSAKYPEVQQRTTDALKQNKGIRIPDLSAKKLIDAGFKFKYGPEEMLDDTVQCCKEKVTCEVAVFPFYVRTVIHIPYNKAMLVRATNRDLISSGIGLLFTIETNVCSSITFFVCIKLIINNMCYVGCCKVVSYLL